MLYKFVPSEGETCLYEPDGGVSSHKEVCHEPDDSKVNLIRAKNRVSFFCLVDCFRGGSGTCEKKRKSANIPITCT